MKAKKSKKKASPGKMLAKVERIESLLSDVLMSKMEGHSLAQSKAIGNVLSLLTVVELNILKQTRHLISQVGTEEARRLTLRRELSGGKYAVNCAGDIYNLRSLVPISEDEPVFLVRSKDRFAMDILRVYHDLCVKAALPVAQLESLSRVDAEIRDWRLKHADRVKNPD